jgi:hypothetical protein
MKNKVTKFVSEGVSISVAGMTRTERYDRPPAKSKLRPYRKAIVVL